MVHGQCTLRDCDVYSTQRDTTLPIAAKHLIFLLAISSLALLRILSALYEKIVFSRRLFEDTQGGK